MTAAGEIRVLLVDDHPVVRGGYRALLENAADIQVVGEADSGEQAYTLYRELTPDVVVVDLNMPGMGGLGLIQRLRAQDARARILVFSMHDSQVMVHRALEAGALGYLAKSSASSLLADAVRQVACGKHYLERNLAPATADAGADPLRCLTRREFQVFQSLAEGQSVAEIAETLCISPKTAGVHQTNIMHKLGLRNAAELVRLAIRCRVIEP